MSSKNRRHQARKQNQRQKSNHPASNPSGGPARNKKHAGGGKKPVLKNLAIFASLALLAGLVVYAMTTTKGDKTGRGDATGSNTPPHQAQVTASRGPQIRFASPLYDFGKATGDDLVNCVFTFTNVGNALLEVTHVDPLCSCMKAGEWSRKVEPGQTGTILVRYDSQHYTGPFLKSISVSCNDTSQPTLMLQIKGTVWRAIEITPPSAVINLSADTPSNATTVRFISHLDEPLTLSDLMWNSTAVSVELQTNQPGKEYQLLVKTVPPWPTTRQQGQITLKTSTTNQPMIDLRMFVNVLPLVNTFPYLVRLPPLPLTNAFSYTVVIRNNGTNVLELSMPTVNAKGVETQMKEEEPGRQFGVTMNFPVGFDVASDEKLELSVKSNLPQFPAIKVPVVVPPRVVPVTVPSTK